MKTFKILKILFFIAISTLLLSCNNVIRDYDNDGESDTLNFVDEVYQLREDYYMQSNIREYESSLKKPNWYKPSEPLYVTSLYSEKQYITKNNVKYEPKNKFVNSAEIYEIIDDDTIPGNIGKFVLITLEPVPIFKEGMVILLVSKTLYGTAEDAQIAAEAINIPKIKMNLSHLDLVFNPTVPEADYLSYENVAENVSAIIAADYELLEFFGTSYSYEEKQKLLASYGYASLFE